MIFFFHRQNPAQHMLKRKNQSMGEKKIIWFLKSKCCSILLVLEMQTPTFVYLITFAVFISKLAFYIQNWNYNRKKTAQHTSIVRIQTTYEEIMRKYKIQIVVKNS